MAVLTFLSVLGAAFLGFVSKTKLPSEQDDTKSVVRLVGNLFVMMTSLVLGLMLNSARNTLETNNRNIRAMATEIILLDRTMRALGPGTEDARGHLVEYVHIFLNDWQGNPFQEDPYQEIRLQEVGTKLRAMRVSGEQMVKLWNDALEFQRQVVRQRWVLVDASGGTIPAPLIILVILWLAIIFAGFGYGAPRNTTVTTSFFLAALLTSAALFLIVDMDTPSTGMFEPIQVSNLPLQRALAQLQR